MQKAICRNHAPRPHCEAICHATCEQRQDVLKKLKCLLNAVDYKKCVLPDVPFRKRPAPVSPYPNPHRPLITSSGTEVTMLTSDPGRSVDDPPDRFYIDTPNLKPKRLPMNTPGRKKSVELKGGIFYGSCFCVKRNGLQGDCPRSDCLGRPECLAISPGPCCEPALAILGKTRGDYQHRTNGRRQSDNIDNAHGCCCKH